MRPKKALGLGTVDDAGRYETHGDRKRASVVALAISSADPGSAVSGATPGCAEALIDTAAERQRNKTHRASMNLHPHSKRVSEGEAQSTCVSGRFQYRRGAEAAGGAHRHQSSPAAPGLIPMQGQLLGGAREYARAGRGKRMTQTH
jgi:hypothetical protein